MDGTRPATGATGAIVAPDAGWVGTGGADAVEGAITVAGAVRKGSEGVADGAVCTVAPGFVMTFGPKIDTK